MPFDLHITSNLNGWSFLVSLRFFFLLTSTTLLLSGCEAPLPKFVNKRSDGDTTLIFRYDGNRRMNYTVSGEKSSYTSSLDECDYVNKRNWSCTDSAATWTFMYMDDGTVTWKVAGSAHTYRPYTIVDHLLLLIP